MTERFEVDELRVASPCNANWDEMIGDDRVRHCEQCQLNVYNFAEMTSNEIRTLVETTEGRLCGRMYRREDGTLLTRNCPKGLQTVRAKALKVASLIAGAVIGLFATVGLGNANENVPCVKPPQTETPNLQLMGGIAPPPPAQDPQIMGEIAPPEPQQPNVHELPQSTQPIPPDHGGMVMGKIKAPDPAPEKTPE